MITPRWWFYRKVSGEGVLLHDLTGGERWAENVADHHRATVNELFGLAKRDAGSSLPDWLMDLATKQADAPGCLDLAARTQRRRSTQLLLTDLTRCGRIGQRAGGLTTLPADSGCGSWSMAENHVFDFSLQRDKLYKQVADQIEEWIVADSLKPGERLPGERELAERMGVSRTVVREAIRVLSVQGLVRVKPGCGTYVQQLSAKSAAASVELFLKLRRSPESFKDIHEVRRMMEVEAAGLAARRATEQDLSSLKAALDGMVAYQETPERYVEYDLEFHVALATASHNELFGVLFAPVAGPVEDIVQISFHEPGAVKGGLIHHRNIFDQVIRRDPDGAPQAMRDHLLHAQNLVETVRARVTSPSCSDPATPDDLTRPERQAHLEA